MNKIVRNQITPRIFL